MPGRVEFVETVDLDPASLVGSHFLVFEDDDVLWKGVVVGEPQAGKYLCHIDLLESGVEKAQIIVPMEQIVLGDGTMKEFRFFDTAMEASAAYANYMAHKETRTT